MTSELSKWLCESEKHYFEKQSDLISEANMAPLIRKSKTSSSQLTKLNTNTATSSLNNNSTSYTHSNSTAKRKKYRRGKDRGFEIPMDARLQLTISQFSRLERKQEDHKRNKEIKLPGQAKKSKGPIEWEGDVQDLLSSYRKGFTYYNSRVARTDKRELLRIAQEVQASHKIRRTCLPILKLPHTVTVHLPPPVLTQTQTANTIPFYRKIDSKNYLKPGETQTTELAKIIRSSKTTLNTIPTANEMQIPKKRKTLTIKENKNKLNKRDYLELKTVNLSIENLPSQVTTIKSKKSIFPVIPKRSTSLPSKTNLKPKEIKGDEPKEPLNKTRKETKISKIMISKDQYRLTINEGGRLEEINVSILPTINNSENYKWEEYFKTANSYDYTDRNGIDQNETAKNITTIIGEPNKITSSTELPFSIYDKCKNAIRERLHGIPTKIKT